MVTVEFKGQINYRLDKNGSSGIAAKKYFCRFVWIKSHAEM